MSLELKESRQAGDPTGLKSNAALADKSTGFSAVGPGLARPERLDPSRPTSATCSRWCGPPATAKVRRISRLPR